MELQGTSGVLGPLLLFYTGIAIIDIKFLAVL